MCGCRVRTCAKNVLILHATHSLKRTIPSFAADAPWCAQGNAVARGVIEQCDTARVYNFVSLGGREYPEYPTSAARCPPQMWASPGADVAGLAAL